MTVVFVFIILSIAQVMNANTEDLSEPLTAKPLGNSLINEVLIGISIPTIIGVAYIILDYHYFEKKQRDRAIRNTPGYNSLMDDIRRMHDTRRQILRADDWENRGITGLNRLRNEWTDKVVVKFNEQRYPIKSAHKKEILTMKPTLGLFDAGLEKFTKKSLEEQERMLHELNYIEEVGIFNEHMADVIIKTETKGRYKVSISAGNVTAKRIENDGSFTFRNPYISDSDYGVCLGSGRELFKKTYAEGNMYECIRLIYHILISEHGHGFRSWLDCRYRRNF